MRKSPRDRRLAADLRSVEQLSAESSIFSFLAKGALPQRYTLVFDGMGISRNAAGKVVPTSHHEVVVELGAAYPRMVPNLAWQTPIYHPNISNNGVVCLGGYGTHWVPSLTLAEMCTMLWDMIRYKNFDIGSPYNRQAALWAQSQTHFNFPVDARPIRNLVAEPGSGKPESAPATVADLGRGSKHWTQRIPFMRSNHDGSSQSLTSNSTSNVNGTSDVGQAEQGNGSSEHVSSAKLISASDVIAVPVDEVSAELVDLESEDDLVEIDDELEQLDEVSSEIRFVDPGEIEVIAPGIQIIESNLDNPVAEATPAPVIPPSNDSGIVFLD